jgi:hypothetical protein
MTQLQSSKFFFDGGDDSIQFSSSFIYVLSSRANGQLQSQHEYKQQQ